MWEDHIGAGESTQLVPIEIALKVASQIRAGKEFAAYIMLPMWPEGGWRRCTRCQERLTGVGSFYDAIRALSHNAGGIAHFSSVTATSGHVLPSCATGCCPMLHHEAPCAVLSCLCGVSCGLVPGFAANDILAERSRACCVLAH